MKKHQNLLKKYMNHVPERRENNVYGISFRKHLDWNGYEKFNEIQDVLDREDSRKV